MLHGDVCSGHLRALLEYESQRVGLPVHYREAALRGGVVLPPFRREVTILAHTEYARERFGLPLCGGGEVLVHIPANIPALPDNAVVLLGADGRSPLGAVVGRVLVVFFSLEALAQSAATLCRRPAGSGEVNVLADLVEQLTTRALPLIEANIHDYDWREEKRRFTEVRLRAVRARVDKLREDTRANDYTIEQKSQEIAQLVHKNRDLREQARLLESFTAREMKQQAEEELVGLMRLAPQAYASLEVEEERIVATTHPVWIEQDEHDFDLGTFRITLRLADDRVTIHKITGASPSGYPHPHVSSSGVPCYGNIGLPLTKLLVEGQYVAALSVLLQFLRSYNRSDAYLSIEHWDSEWREERWDRCYDNASNEDCIDCGDSDCPYYEDRYERCWESHRQDVDDLQACIRCRECDNHAVAQDLCRELSALSDCIDCSEQGCDYANNQDDMRSCRESAADCQSCPAASCHHQGQPQDTPEDNEEEAA